jgi:hypothetical protein
MSGGILTLSFIRRSAFDVHRPKEWWTPIRRAHEEPMGGENHFSLSPHGQAIRRSPLLGKSYTQCLSLHFDVQTPSNHAPSVGS